MHMRNLCVTFLNTDMVRLEHEINQGYQRIRDDAYFRRQIVTRGFRTAERMLDNHMAPTTAVTHTSSDVP